jgi:glycerophosphoryl diester phosphodiesterase
MLSSPSALLDALLAPAPVAARVAFLTGQAFAHRGLHDASVPENSRAAFAAALAAGHGIECDVRASRDGVVYVFHDATLDRLTGEAGPFAERAARMLDHVTLHNGEAVPRLEEMLRLVAGKAPLLIEVKADSAQVGALCLAVRRALEGYRGPHAVMSFNPEVARWFARHSARTVRGLVVTEEHDRNLKGAAKRHLALWRARPDFLAYDVRDLPSRFAAAQRARGLPVLTWTVRDAAAREAAAAHADSAIYERG